MRIDSPQVQAGIKRYGSLEAYRDEMRRRQKKSRENYTGNGGFRGIDKDKHRRIARMGGIAAAKKRVERETEEARLKAYGVTPEQKAAQEDETVVGQDIAQGQDNTQETQE